MRQLIVNADDFGLTCGVNRAVLELHQAGALSSATLMANAPATQDAISLALQFPALGVGCHVVLVDGSPVLPPSQIPTLTDPHTGNLYSKLGEFLRHLLLGHIDPSEIQAEAAAQIALLKNRGLSLTHFDTHKHTHMFPAVLRPVLGAARAAGIRALRNPFEPAWSRRATRSAPLTRRIEVSLLQRLQPNFLRIVAAEGFATTSGSVSVLATGTLNSHTIQSQLQEMPAGAWELVTHPGYNDADLAQVATRLRESRETEREALMDLAKQTTAHLVSFAALLPPGTAVR